MQHAVRIGRTETSPASATLLQSLLDCRACERFVPWWTTQPLAGASTQLATGDFEIEEEEQPDGTQPADDHDMHEATQGANDQAEADCARFVLEAGPREAPASFEVPWEHGAKAELGRASGTAAGAQRIVLCNSAAQGVSRQHGWLRYDQRKGLLYTGCASSSLAVTFFNGAFLAPTAAPVILNNGDTLGFGGASQAAPGSATIVYKAVFINAPPLVPMPPPPPRDAPARPAPARPTCAPASRTSSRCAIS